MIRISFLLMAVLLVGTAAFAQKYEASFQGINEIQLTTGSADCDIVKSSGNTVTITLVHELGKDYQPEVEQRDSKLVIRDNKSKGKWGDMKWTLEVPDNMEINYTAGSGDIHIRNLKVELKSITGSGDIILDGVNGEFFSNTGSGDIQLINFNGELKANTGSGDIRISNLKGEVTLNTGSGDIEIDGANAKITANTGSGDIDASGVVLAGTSAFNAGSGNVLLKIDKTPEYNLSLNSGSGDAVLDRNGNQLNANIRMSANKRNGEISAPFKFDREEEIDEGNSTIMRKYASVGSGDKVDINIGTGSGKAAIK